MGTPANERIVAFVFTDIESSTRLWEQQPDEMSLSLKRHNTIVSSRIELNEGHVFKATGDGYCAVFPNPIHAVRACLSAQTELAKEKWQVKGGIKVRMAIHVGAAEKMGDDFIGPTLNRTARVLDLGHGGQILLTSACHALVADELSKTLSFNSLGSYELAGLMRSEEVFQVSEHPVTFPPLRSRTPAARAPKHNIPPDPRPFIGRRAERERLAQSIRDHGKRLITLTGIGGIGKSRLAKEVAIELAPSFESGAALIECHVLSNRDEIVASALSALGVVPDDLLPEERLIEHLRRSSTLLLFDCFEGLTEHASLLDTLLRAAPRLKCIVTSRAVLGIEWEFEFPLGPLSFRPDAAGATDGVSLFEEAARHVHGGFQLGRKNRSQVAALVRELEGVPLAIVLAAGRLRHLTLAELRVQVSQNRLDILKKTATTDDRHANLRDVIRGSFAMLAQKDQDLATALSIFEGGFFLEDAIAVLGAWSDPLDGISRLRDHSLLVAQSDGEQMRYRALDTVREYLSTAEFAPDLAALRLAHAKQFARKAQVVRDLFECGQWQPASAKLWADAGNFRSAIRFALSRKDSELIKTFAVTLARCYMEAGVRSEFELLAGNAARIARESGNDAFLAEVLGLQGAFARRNGNLELAAKQWRERLSVGMRMKSSDVEADCLIDMADLALARGHNEEAAELASEFDKRLPYLSEEFLKASGEALNARLAMLRNDRRAAVSHSTAASLAIEGIKPNTAFFYVCGSLIDVHRKLGNFDEAELLCRKLLLESLNSGWPHFALKSLFELSETCAMSNKLEEAARAISVAAKVPRSQVFSLRDEAKRRILKFRGEFGDQLLEAASSWAERSDWVSLAAVLAEGKSSLGKGLSDHTLDLRVTQES